MYTIVNVDHVYFVSSVSLLHMHCILYFAEQKRIYPKQPKCRALMIALNWIDDALMAQPFLSQLVKLHPNLKIDVVASTWWVAFVLERMLEICDVYATNFSHSKLQLLRRWKLARDLRCVSYDAVYVLSHLFKSALIPWFAYIPLRIGYTKENRYRLLNIRHANPCKSNESASMVGYYMALIYTYTVGGAQILPGLLMLYLEAALNEALRHVLTRFSSDTHLPLIVFCPGAKYGPAKCWPPEHFATLGQMIGQSPPCMQIVAIGSAKDIPLAQAISECSPGGENLCGQTAFNEACALILRAIVVIINDARLMHVTAALRWLFVFAVFGSTDPHQIPPLSKLAKAQWLHLVCSLFFSASAYLATRTGLYWLDAKRVFSSLYSMLLTYR